MLKNKIRDVRKQCGLTIQQLADKAKTSHAQIVRLEKGDRRLTVEWIDRIATALQCDPMELIVSNNTQHNDSIIDQNILSNTICAVEDWIILNAISITSHQKSKAICSLYTHIMNNSVSTPSAQEIKLVINTILSQ
jgi:transcriptional regulator with XRE-family HTH domain